MDILAYIIIGLPILLASTILHEVAHGLVADKLGDPTPRLMGRLTLNPIPHIDPLMSILLPLILIISGSPIVFGAARPVQVDPFNLREGRKDMALVALAGPLTNILLAVLASLLIRVVPSESPLLIVLLPLFQINLLLAIFNLLPIPPIDGSKVFSMILPEKEANAYLSLGQFGMFIIFFLLLFPIGGFSLGSLIRNLMNVAQSILLP